MSHYDSYGTDPTAYAAQQQQPQVVDPRPPGISEKQDTIIQHVAEYVVHSCDSARYQHKLRNRTKFNSYFSFLDPSHNYHNYYEYLLKSYAYWKEQAMAAAQVGAMSVATEDPSRTAATAQSYYANYDDYYQDSGVLQQPSASTQAEPLVNHPVAEAGWSGENHAAVVDEDDEEEQYELVMENGVQRLVPRRH